MKKTIIILIAILLFSISVGSASAVFFQGTIGYGDNVRMSISTNTSFTAVETNSSYFRLSDYYFYITTSNSLNLSLNHIRTASDAVDAKKILEFTANGSGSVLFAINGVKQNQQYDIHRDGISILKPTSSNVGRISFINSDWSNHTFSIYQYESDDGSGSPGGWIPGSDAIWCYRCYDGEQQSDQFPGETCPEGWFPDQQDCDSDGLSVSGSGYDVGAGVLIILLLVIVFFAVFRFRAYEVVKILKPKPSIYWFAFAAILVIGVLWLFS